VASATTTTTAVLRPFVWDYPGELVHILEETLTPILLISHPLSASSIYYNP